MFSKTFARYAATAALTVLAIGALTPTALADPDPVGPRAGDFNANYLTAPCDARGATGRDAAIADRLAGVLAGELANKINAYRVSCARMVVKAVRDRGLSERAAVIAITTTIVESTIQNVAEKVDHTSLGLFQQQDPWGSEEQRLNPTWATNAFLNAMIRKYPNNSWQSAPIGEVCQKVQVSAFPDRYQPQAGNAGKIVDALWVPPYGADFDGNGVGDLFATADGKLYVWNGEGGNEFGARVEVGAGWSAFGKPISGDFDGDGRSDLAAIRDGSTLFVWNGEGGNKFGPAEQVGGGWGPYGNTLTSVGDVNGDGRDDIAAITDGTLFVWNGEGGNRFGPAEQVGGGWGPYGKPVGGDFNADGRGDLAAIRDGSTLFVWNGEGGNEFGPAVQVGGGWGPYGNTLMSLGDVNRDGRGDIAAITDGTLFVWNGRSANGFGPAVRIGGGWGPYI
ncbi:FG-GAP repeat domain-containing protein [Streptosporangium sp. KLBMP 9127]|nr:VCBS repeat-containing protein [Streptosporangium sp. KLBMP 9127]